MSLVTGNPMNFPANLSGIRKDCRKDHISLNDIEMTEKTTSLSATATKATDRKKNTSVSGFPRLLETKDLFSLAVSCRLVELRYASRDLTPHPTPPQDALCSYSRFIHHLS